MSYFSDVTSIQNLFDYSQPSFKSVVDVGLLVRLNNMHICAYMFGMRQKIWDKMEVINLYIQTNEIQKNIERIRVDESVGE